MFSPVIAVLRQQYLGALALFVALGGTSYAAVRLEPASVGTREIKNGSVARADLASRSVTTSNIAPSAVTGPKIAPNSVNSDDVEDHSLEPRDLRMDLLPEGQRGPKGQKGDNGAPGPDGSPDSPAQVLAKLRDVDGAGSGLDADLFHGLPVDAFQRRITGECGGGRYLQSVAADGSVGCGADADNGGDITSVVAGHGLTGGATTGEARLDVAIPLRLEQGAGSSTEPVVGLGQAAQGSALSAEITNSTSRAPTLDIGNAGFGPGVVAKTKGTGIWGVTSSMNSAAVLGDNDSGEVIVGRQTGAGCATRPLRCKGIGAVVGRHDGPGGYGVRGFITDPDGGSGVLGQSGISRGGGPGVRGENVNAASLGNGVEGVTNGRGAGIYGSETSADPAALAGRFDGNVQINGNLTVTGTKSGFWIDDPRAPADRTLTHTPVESDARTVVYTGNVRTGRDGRATVRLAAYAGVLAGRWRYQLTPIGRFGQAIVERGVRGRSFVVRTEHPWTKVSWAVTGLRLDPYVRRHPFRVVEDKTAAQRGRYVHPELWSAPASMALGRPLAPTPGVARSTSSGRPLLASEQTG